MLPVVRLELNEKRFASLRFPPTSAKTFSSTVPVCFPHLSPAKATLIYLLLSSHCLSVCSNDGWFPVAVSYRVSTGILCVCVLGIAQDKTGL